MREETQYIKLAVVKWFWIGAIFGVFWTPLTWALEADSSEYYAKLNLSIDRLGRVPVDTILADAQGKVFLDFKEGTRVIYDDSFSDFQGEIFGPSILNGFQDPLPDPVFKYLLSFEFIGSLSGGLRFIDPSYKYPYKLRNLYHFFAEATENNEQHLYAGAGSEGLGSVRVYIELPEYWQVKKPILWEYVPSSEVPWIRRGGLIKTLSGGKTVFHTQIFNTGTFLLVDEDPYGGAPPPVTRADGVELAPTAPYFSVDPGRDLNAEIWAGIPLEDQNPFHDGDEFAPYVPTEEILIPPLEGPDFESLQAACDDPILSASIAVVESQLCERLASSSPEEAQAYLEELWTDDETAASLEQITLDPEGADDPDLIPGFEASGDDFFAPSSPESSPSDESLDELFNQLEDLDDFEDLDSLFGSADSEVDDLLQSLQAQSLNPQAARNTEEESIPLALRIIFGLAAGMFIAGIVSVRWKKSDSTTHLGDHVS